VVEAVVDDLSGGEDDLEACLDEPKLPFKNLNGSLGKLLADVTLLGLVLATGVALGRRVGRGGVVLVDVGLLKRREDDLGTFLDEGELEFNDLDRSVREQLKGVGDLGLVVGVTGVVGLGRRVGRSGVVLVVVGLVSNG
jgi:hypothetical protein